MKKQLIIIFLIARISLAADHTKEAPTPEVLMKIQDAAKAGNAQAEFELGCLLSTGEYVSQNTSEAFRLFLESAKQGYSNAQYKVGMAYFNGEGVPKDQKEGLAWMYLAIADGAPISVCQSMEGSLGKEASEAAKMRSQELISTLSNDAREFLNLKTKASDGDPETEYKLGLCYKKRKTETMFLSDSVRQVPVYSDDSFYTHVHRESDVYWISLNELKEAIKWITKAAEQGYAPAQNELGIAHAMGNITCIEHNDDTPGKYQEEQRCNAISWWAKAATRRYAPAQNNLGVALINGWMDDVRASEKKESGKDSTFEEMNAAHDKDKQAALALFQKAADQGYAPAQNSLGDFYAKGEMVEKDIVQAAKWYSAAAVKGNLWAQLSLGDAYLNGKGVDKNFAEAVKWYQKAAEQGDNKANRMLGNMYHRGEGVEKDPKKANQYWEKAAGAGGDEIAMRHLGDAYFNGEGVEKDLKEAYFWHQRAGNLGDSRGAVATGDACLNGWGVEKNVKEAKSWYGAGAIYCPQDSEPVPFPPALEKLSKMGEWSAALLLGEWYLNSKSVKGIDWMKSAASRGSADAKFVLACAYYEGEKLPKDQIEGLAWMYLTAASEFNKQADIKWGDYPRAILFEQAVKFRPKISTRWFLEHYIQNRDDLDAWEKDPNCLISLSKRISDEWEKTIGQEASLKAQQRAKELKQEIDNIDKPATSSPTPAPVQG